MLDGTLVSGLPQRLSSPARAASAGAGCFPVSFNAINAGGRGLNSGSGHAEVTTQSAVADGAIIVRDQANQKQDVSTLSRDTDHANGSIGPIFNKWEA